MNEIEACEVCGRKYNKSKMKCPGCAAQKVVDADRKDKPLDNFPYVSRTSTYETGTSAPEARNSNAQGQARLTEANLDSNQTIETSDSLLLSEVKKLQKTQSRIEDTLGNIAKGLGLVFTSAFLSGIALFCTGLSDGSSSSQSALWAGAFFGILSLFAFVSGTRTLLNA